MIEVRKSKIEDTESIIELLMNFKTENNFSPQLCFADPDYQRLLITRLIQYHVLVVATKDDKIIGAIAGYLHPHIFDPKIKVCSELFWFVEKEHRPSKASLELISLYKEFAGEYSNLIYMNILTSTNIKEKSLLRRGFKKLETVYLFERI